MPSPLSFETAKFFTITCPMIGRDVSECPIAGKSAVQVREQIERFGHADVVGVIEPKGSITAGDYDKPWMGKKAKA